MRPYEELIVDIPNYPKPGVVFKDLTPAFADADAFAAMVDGLGDKWSYYMSPSEYEAYKLYSSNQYTGLGVSLDKDTETGGFVIKGVTADSPAANAGLEEGEIILAVNDQDLTSMTIGDARSYISSNLSKSVSVKIINADGNETTVNVDCSVAYTNPVSYEMLEGSIGYVRILSFDAGSGEAAVSAAAAFALAAGIALQNVPEGAVISMPLVGQGMGRGRAFLAGLLSGVVEPVGALLTILLTGLITPALPYILSFAAGAMIYVVVEELIPEAQAGEHSNIGTIGAALGFVLMMILDVALG